MQDAWGGNEMGRYLIEVDGRRKGSVGSVAVRSGSISELSGRSDHVQEKGPTAVIDEVGSNDEGKLVTRG